MAPDPAVEVEGAATGLGSWPGEELAGPLSFIRDTLTDLPHLLELPARGPGADLIGRGASLLVDLPVELQPHGWRLSDAPGRDLRRGRSFLRSDLDLLAEVFDGYDGPLKVQVTGPWTLAASLWLPRGERALTDPGARREIIASLADGIVAHLAEVRSAVPAARLTVQIDEPSLPAVLAGRLPRASGYGLVRAVDRVEVEQGLAAVLAAVRASVHTSEQAMAQRTVLHCCAADPPVALLARAGADALSVDLAMLGQAAWDVIGEAVDGGLRLWAGVDAGALEVTALLASIVEPWRRIGLDQGDLAAVVVTPSCGLAGYPPDVAEAVIRRVIATGRALAESAHDG